MTPDQITASRDRLISEGFTAGSPAIRVHDQLIEAMRKIDGLCQLNDRNTESAWQCMEELKAECERRGKEIRRLSEALEPYATAYHRRIRAGNDKPGCQLQVWVSDHVRARDALGLNSPAKGDGA